MYIIVVVTIHQIYSFSFPKRQEKDSIEASWLKQWTFLHSDMRQNISLGACAWLYKLLGLALNFPHFFLWACVTLSGFHLLGGAGGEASPPTSPQKVLTINTISNNKNSGFMFFRALVIDTQKWAQKRCMLHTQLILASTQSSPPQTKNPRWNPDYIHSYFPKSLDNQLKKTQYSKAAADYRNLATDIQNSKTQTSLLMPQSMHFLCVYVNCGLKSALY